jgi:hypothetical protein
LASKKISPLRRCAPAKAGIMALVPWPESKAEKSTEQLAVFEASLGNEEPWFSLTTHLQ